MTTTHVTNDTLLTINNRRSIRQFTDQPVSPEQIHTILHAANQAPSAHNQQSWRFIVIRGKKKQALSNFVNTKAADFPRASATLLRMASRSISSAPLVIAVANTGELIRHGTELFKIEEDNARDFFRTMEIQSSAAAVENMLLAITSLGLAAVWLGILYLVKNDVLEFLGEPQGEFMAVVPMGYAANPGKLPKKQPLNMVVKYLGDDRL